MAAPNKLGKRHTAAMVDALTSAVIAFRMGRAGEDHYYTLMAGTIIADEIACIVDRHKHLRDDIKPALLALGAIFDRQAQRTVKDAFWAATPEEADSLDLAVEIYKALMKTTPGTAVSKAMRRAMAELKPGGKP